MGQHKKGCATKATTNPEAFVNEATPQKPPKDARVYKQKHDTPSGNHTIVEMNVYSGLNAPSGTVADPDAELVGCMTRSRRRKLDESSGDKQAQRDYSKKWTRLDRAALKHSQDRLNRRILEDEHGPQPKPGSVRKYASRFNRRNDETERQRYDRVMVEFGQVYERQGRLRERDAAIRVRLHDESHAAEPNRTWPPPAPRDVDGEPPKSNLGRLQTYFEALDGLPTRIETCSNCSQKSCTGGIGDGAPGTDHDGMCWFCREKPNVLNWTNGLDLDLRPDASDTEFTGTETPNAARLAFAKLLHDHGKLSPMEEAMIAPVSACFSVLKLPSGGQLGYRGNVINFPFDVGKVAAQLPRAAADCSFVVYRVRYKRRRQKSNESNTEDGDDDEPEQISKLEKVRRQAVSDYIHFFVEHHKYFRSGITSKDGQTVWVAPITINRDVLDALPDNGRPDDLIVNYIDDEVIDEDRDENADDGDGSGSETSDADDPNDLDVNGSLLGRWVRDGTGPIACALRASHPSTNAESITSFMFGIDDPQAVRPSSVKLSRLVRRVMVVSSTISEFGPQSADTAVISDVVYRELRGFVAKLGIQLDDSGAVHGQKDAREGETPADAALRELEDAIAGVGTSDSPFECPNRNEIPLSETDAPGYMTMAFPALFPFGLGSFSDARHENISFEQWTNHLHRFHDDRFNAHPRWPFFVQNTRERAIANETSANYVPNAQSAHGGFDLEALTIGELKALSKEDKFKVMLQISKFGRSLRNTPGFFTERRKELQSMCDALGDPHVFATHSFADTFCPYLAEFILKWRNIERNGRQSPFETGISDKEAKSRKWKLLEANPALAAHFFALKTELYLEHICVGILGAQAYWSRYEWQSRGSTHAHYFLWLDNAPNVTHLDEWIREEVDLNRTEPNRAEQNISNVCGVCVRVCVCVHARARACVGVCVCVAGEPGLIRQRRQRQRRPSRRRVAEAER